jgi:YD repeat-containing protein
MKVFISKYRDHWISPYTILEKVFFWREIDYDEPKIKMLHDILNPFCVEWKKTLDFLHPRINYVRIDPWDTWSMDSTLAPIILPMLKQLKANHHGAPYVKDDDVPEGMGLRSTEAERKENDWDTDSNYFKRWEWVLDEMIFAFECKVDDSWQDAFRSGKIDWKTEPCVWDDAGKPTMYRSVDGPNHTYKCDYDGMKKVEDRIQNGFRLFGTYYQSLWD